MDGHIFITLLAYHLMHSIIHVLRQHGVHNNWHAIRTWLRSHMRVTLSYVDIAETKTYIRKTSDAEKLHKKVYAAFEITEQPGSIWQTSIDLKRSGKKETTCGFI